MNVHLPLLLLVVCGAQAAVSLRFLPEAKVEGRTLQVGQIAKVSGPDIEVSAVAAFPVGPAAGFGLTRAVEGENIAQALREKYPSIKIENPGMRIQVATLADTMPTRHLVQRLDALIAGLPVATGGKLGYTLMNIPPLITLPRFPHELQFEFSGKKRRGKVALDFSVIADGRKLRTYPLSLNVVVEEPVRVTSRRILRGEKLDADNTRMEMRETTHLAREGLPEPEKILGMLARHTLQEGMILTHHFVDWPPLVRRGETARLVAQGTGLLVTTEVVCRQNGSPGQIISARHPETRRLLRARVLASGDLEPVPQGI